MAESTMKIEDGTVQTYTVRGAQRNRDGSVLEGARVFVTFKFDLERVEAHLGTLARLIKRDRVVKFLEMKFIEQLELEALRDHTPVGAKSLKDPLGTFPKNGRDDSKAREVLAGANATGGELVTSSGPAKKRSSKK